MKVIKKQPLEEITIKCVCKSILSYTNVDLKYYLDIKGQTISYIVCPICEVELRVKK